MYANRPFGFSFLVVALALLGAGCHHKGTGYVDGGVPDDFSLTAPDFSVVVDFAMPPVDLGPACTPTTCTALGATCGPVADGCGGLLDCGASCPVNTSCGGGGTPSVCGTSCVPATCASLGYNCGSNGDGCGGTLNCGTCSNGDTCGGGGSPSKCGNTSVCTPTTCTALGYNCGAAGDGCGNTLSCGTCSGTNVCGGGGVPSQCGHAACVPKTCASVGSATCGPIGDGCGGIVQCGGCSEPKTCGGSVPGQCSIPTSCTNLCLQQQACTPSTVTTTISGYVYAPNGTDPLPNILVFVPNAPVQPFAPGVACEQCKDSVSGSPLVSTATDTSGHFVLKDVPVGTNIPLVMQTGRWRRQVVIPMVTACQDNPQTDKNVMRLPRNQSEGDIPHMAFVTGRVDALECVMRRIGLDDAEFTGATGAGRVHLFKGDGVTATFDKGLGGAVAATGGTANEDDLMGSATTLASYDLVLFPCKGDEYLRPVAQQSNLINYANAGGRVFATHFSYTWLFNDAPFSSTAQWQVEQSPRPATPQTGYINTSFPKGVALAQWLQSVGASTTLGQILIQVLRIDFNKVVAPTQSWLTINDDATYPGHTMYFTFNTPVGATSANQCGRVVFDDFHVENVSSNATYNATFPAECPAGSMTPQEKLLEYLIFDLGSCVTPDIPVCTKTTCPAQNIGCGPAGDGCGGQLDCGTCVAPKSCGGGGTPSQCGQAACTQTTCAAQGIQCGPAGDGCGGLLACGTCPAGQTCGGGGMPGVCGTKPCTPITCTQQGFNCGPAGNGCGDALDCGTCTPPQTCGGSGTPGVCGQLCIPKTCKDLGFDCGPAGDGCGGAINCGTCNPPATCGGGGQSNVCGGGVVN